MDICFSIKQSWPSCQFSCSRSTLFQWSRTDRTSVSRAVTPSTHATSTARACGSRASDSSATSRAENQTTA